MRITAVSDLGENSFSLGYTDDQLTTLEMPGGCLVEFGYDSNNLIASRTDMSSASTLYSYDSQARLTQIKTPIWSTWSTRT
jgi:YD repeat-containing protein